MSPVKQVMSDVMNVIEVEVNSSCVCVAYDDYGNEVEAGDCYGCFDDSLEDLEYSILLPWLKAQDADNGDYIVVRGSNVGWMRVSGEATLELDYDDVLDDLVKWFGLNGDFRLTFKLADGEFTVRRGSHDEPMGAYFDLRLVKAERVEEVI